MKKQRYFINRNKIKFGFKKVDPTDESLLNKVSNWLTSSKDSSFVYQHVEVIFSNDYISSATRANGVHYTNGRSLSSGSYSRFFSLYLTPNEEKKMILFAKNACKNNIKFNTLGMYLNFVPCCMSVNYKGSSVFCSEYVIQMLQICGYLMDLDAHLTSPTGLAVAMKEDAHFKITENDFIYKKR